MTFLAPLLAGLAALASVPLIIWLLNRSRFKVVRWPALEFLLKTLQKSSRRLQLRELILLLLRTLAVLFIALALARPSIGAGGAGVLGLRGGVSAVIILDHSLSMQARDGSGSRFENAKARAQELVGKLPRGSAAALVLMSDMAVAELAEPSQDLAYVAQAIEAAQPSDGGTSVVAGLTRAMEILRETSGRREIYLVGDLQERGWPSPDDRAWKALAEELAEPGAPALFLAEIGGEALRDNVQIEAFSATDDLVTTDAPTTFTAVVRNRGGAPANDVQIELWTEGDDGRLRKAGGAVVDRLETVTEVALEARLEPGLRRVQARLLPDRLAADDTRQVVVEAVDKVRVLVVDGAEGAKGGGAEFVRAALAPLAALSGTQPPNGAPALPEPEDEDGPQSDLFRVEVIGASAVSQVDLAAYQAVVLTDPASPLPGLGEALAAWLSGGRGLILMPGSRAEPESWNSVLAAVAPAALDGGARDLVDERGAKGQGLETTGLVHPVVSFFAAPQFQQFLSQPRFWRAHGLRPHEGSTGVLAFADGAPALVERTIGRGAVLMTAFPSDKAWSDLPLRPAFLMLMRRMVQHAALGNRPRLTVRVHDPLRLVVPARLAGARVEASDPHGGTHVLNPEPLPDGSARVELADTPSAGFYQLRGADRPWWFAVNPPHEESDPAILAREEAVLRLEPAPVRWIGAADDAGASVDRARAGVEIWWILFALAVACLVAESVLVVKWAPKDA